MTNISAFLVKKLRARTGVGIMDCKRALMCMKGDIDKSVDFLRKMGQIKAEKKQFLLTQNGSIFISFDHNLGVMLELSSETDFVSKHKDFLCLGEKILDYVLTHPMESIEFIRKHFEDLRTSLVMQVNENIVIRRIQTLNKKYITGYLHGRRIGVLVQTSSINNHLAKEIAMHIAASNPKYLRSDLVPKSIMEREYEIQLELAMQSKKSKPILEKIIKGRMIKFANEISLLGQNFIFDPHRKVSEVILKNNIDVISFVRYEVGEKYI
ncbi:elongation factor Ts [Buchnera aphidicola str. Bp (Baizongia pistaciae)]|uniref:Elongation factor Ts n=1 Tax=Buchnera aphidicola subsp. Baizongia pistaciae (strain Bp) TaxID=224915 RepID=EFTS_BUCBP|nr:translation elongation factor Ts [Buchnera aphidicola]P59431.1 RecName: Full=Elongation factor Ts; Short=EF-Ts [Buchnera aphidicola str. Bp (Baizongia pistaciae)]AAO26946.1 elongation factor Ts [Buchnera aphidicola str. Bp (Baizongia pistaciae)]